ncbi:MAG: AMMECR1 domain-containing protein [Coriobacteriaceae bacterium]
MREEDREIGGARGGSPAWPPHPGDDPSVALARASVESIVAQGTVLPLPTDAPEELTGRRAGAFVSLHKHGQLRGCIGTIAPVRKSLAEEVIRNGVAAATEDPRFAPVRPGTSTSEYSVDVLGNRSRRQPGTARPRATGSSDPRASRAFASLLEGVDTVFDRLPSPAKRASDLMTGAPRALRGRPPHRRRRGAQMVARKASCRGRAASSLKTAATRIS